MSTEVWRDRRQDGAGPARPTASVASSGAQIPANSRRRRREEAANLDEDVQLVTVANNNPPVVVDLTDTPGTSGAQDDDDVVFVRERVERRRRLASPLPRQHMALVNSLSIFLGQQAPSMSHRHHILLQADGTNFSGHNDRLVPTPALVPTTHAGAGPSGAVVPHVSPQANLPMNVPPNVARMLAEAPPSPQRPGLKCPICLEGMEKMVSTPCGHVFCEACLTEALKTRKQCPKCRKTCAARQIHRIFLE